MDLSFVLMLTALGVVILTPLVAVSALVITLVSGVGRGRVGRIFVTVLVVALTAVIAMRVFDAATGTQSSQVLLLVLVISLVCVAVGLLTSSWVTGTRPMLGWNSTTSPVRDLFLILFLVSIAVMALTDPFSSSTVAVGRLEFPIHTVIGCSLLLPTIVVVVLRLLYGATDGVGLSNTFVDSVSRVALLCYYAIGVLSFSVATYVWLQPHS